MTRESRTWGELVAEHVRVYRESAAGFADERVVDLRGAALLGAS